jgi:hypothetical protein
MMTRHPNLVLDVQDSFWQLYGYNKVTFEMWTHVRGPRPRPSPHRRRPTPVR